MSTTIQTNSPPSFLQKIFGSSTSQQSPPVAIAPTAAAYGSDSVQVASTPQDPSQLTAGFGKKVGDMFGEMFSDLAYAMKMGESYKLVEAEFQKMDFIADGVVDSQEFVGSTLNLSGHINPDEFFVADRNHDGRLTKSEYAKYRKERLESSFTQKDLNGDRHLNIGEMGSVGRIFLANRDPRLDGNLDGLVNKREYVKAQLTLGISIRDVLGF